MVHQVISVQFQSNQNIISIDNSLLVDNW